MRCGPAAVVPVRGLRPPPSPALLQAPGPGISVPAARGPSLAGLERKARPIQGHAHGAHRALAARHGRGRRSRRLGDGCGGAGCRISSPPRDRHSDLVTGLVAAGRPARPLPPRPQQPPRAAPRGLSAGAPALSPPHPALSETPREFEPVLMGIKAGPCAGRVMRNGRLGRIGTKFFIFKFHQSVCVLQVA